MNLNINEIIDLQKKSQNKRAFLYMKDNKWYVCDDLKNMPFLNTTIGQYIENLEKENKGKIDKLEKDIQTLKEQNKLLAESVSTLIKK